jgi:hypothetical protein
MNNLPISKPLSAKAVAWTNEVVTMLVRDGMLVEDEPKNDAQLKICGTGRDAITGLPILVCRSRLADGPVIKLISLNPASGNMYMAVFSLSEFKATCRDTYRDCEAAILSNAKATTRR